MKKAYVVISFVSLIVFVSLFSGFGSDAAIEGKEERLSHILEQTWENHEVNAYSVNTTDSVLYFKIADTEDKSKFHQAIHSKLEKHNIDNQYTLKIDYESDIKDRLGLESGI
ncbi:hypothetical protein [Virgibacillus kimchii]